MGYAAAGVCFETGEEATLMLSSLRAGFGGNPCPYVWNAGKADYYSLVNGVCTVSTTKVTFPTCTEPGGLGANESDLWNLTPQDGALIAGAILAVWAIAWGFRAVLKSLNQLS